MANFCKECSIAHFGKDFGDLAKLMPESDYDEDHGALDLCECCGPVVVDYEGKRMNEDFNDDCSCAEMVKSHTKERRMTE